MHHVWVVHVTLSPSALFWGKVNSKFSLSVSVSVSLSVFLSDIIDITVISVYLSKVGVPNL